MHRRCLCYVGHIERVVSRIRIDTPSYFGSMNDCMSLELSRELLRGLFHLTFSPAYPNLRLYVSSLTIGITIRQTIIWLAFGTKQTVCLGPGSNPDHTVSSIRELAGKYVTS